MGSRSPRHKLDRTPPGGRIEGLDVLRGLAVGLVMLHHSWIDTFGAGGIVGVLIFFTLSGYLITGLLVGDLLRGGRIRYGRFYRNRALRLLPALYVLLAGIALVTLTIDPRDERGGLLGGILVAVLYVANLPLGVDFFTIVHLWTLSTEEQFYLVWPMVLAIGIRFRILRWLVLFAGVAIMGIVFLTLSVVDAPGAIYQLPTSWAIAMVIGAAAQLGAARIVRTLPSVSSPAGGLVFGTALAAVIALSLLPLPDDWAISYYLGAPLVAVLSVVLIFGAREWAVIPTQLLRPLLLLGTVSYAAYLWNWPIAFWLGVDTNHTTAPVLALVLTVVAATLSWWLVERPVAAWRARLDARARERAAADEVRETVH